MKVEQEKTRYAIKLAEALLRSEGEITFSEIRAIPFVDDERTANLVVNYLFRNFDVSIEQRRRYDRAGVPIEDVIVLRNPEARQLSDAIKSKKPAAPVAMWSRAGTGSSQTATERHSEPREIPMQEQIPMQERRSWWSRISRIFGS
jgi:hypothetical protein